MNVYVNLEWVIFVLTGQSFIKMCQREEVDQLNALHLGSIIAYLLRRSSGPGIKNTDTVSLPSW